MLEAPRNMIGLLVQLEQESAQNPDDIQLMQRLARLYLKNGAVEESARVLEKILRIEPDNALITVEMAGCRIRQQQYQEAEFLLERAQELKPGLYAIFLTWSKLYEALRQTQKQVSYLMLAAAAAPEKAEIRLALADLLKRHGDINGAVSQYRNLLEDKPDFEPALFALGNLLMSRNELNEAMQCFRRIVNRNPGAFDAHFNLGNCLFRQRKYKMALSHFRFSSRSKDLIERSLYLSAQCWLNLKDHDRAIVTMEKLVNFDENNLSYQKGLAEVYMQAEEYDLARDSWRFLTVLAPERSEFLVSYAETLVRLHNLEEAQKALDDLFRRHPGHLEGHRLLAEIYLQKGLFSDAIEEYKRTLMINEDYALVYLGLARVYKETGDFSSEYEALSRAAELGIEEPKMLLRLGQLEKRLNLPTSLDRFRRITELVPDTNLAREAQYYLKHQAA